MINFLDKVPEVQDRVKFYPPPLQRRNRRFVYYTLHMVLSCKEHFFMNPVSANFIVIQLLLDLNISMGYIALQVIPLITKELCHYTLLLGAMYFHKVSGRYAPEYSHITPNERALRAHVLPHYTR